MRILTVWSLHLKQRKQLQTKGHTLFSQKNRVPHQPPRWWDLGIRAHYGAIQRRIAALRIQTRHLGPAFDREDAAGAEGHLCVE